MKIICIAKTDLSNERRIFFLSEISFSFVSKIVIKEFKKLVE